MWGRGGCLEGRGIQHDGSRHGAKGGVRCVARRRDALVMNRVSIRDAAVVRATPTIEACNTYVARCTESSTRDAKQRSSTPARGGIPRRWTQCCAEEGLTFLRCALACRHSINVVSAVTNESQQPGSLSAWRHGKLETSTVARKPFACVTSPTYTQCTLQCAAKLLSTSTPAGLLTPDCFPFLRTLAALQNPDESIP